MAKNLSYITNVVYDLYTLSNNIDTLSKSKNQIVQNELAKYEQHITRLKDIMTGQQNIASIRVLDDNLRYSLNDIIHEVPMSLVFSYIFNKQIIQNPTTTTVIYRTASFADNYLRNYHLLEVKPTCTIINTYGFDSITWTGLLNAYAENNNLNLITKLLSIKEKSYNDLIKRYHGDDIILQPYMGCAYDIKNNVFIIDQYLTKGSRSTCTIKDLYLLLNPEKHWLKEDILDNITKELRALIDPIIEQFNWVNTFLIEEKIKEKRLINIRSKHSTLNADINNLKDVLKDKIHKLEEVTAMEYYLENSKTDYKLAATLNRLMRSDNLKTYTLEDGVLVLYWKPMPILYFDASHLEKAIPNLGVSETRQGLLQKVAKEECVLMTLPFKTKITLETLNFLNVPMAAKSFSSSSINGWNRHPMYNSYRGCLGTFDLPVFEAKQEYDLTKLIMLISQYYKTITINDVLGNSNCRYLPICDENFKVIDFPYKAYWHDQNIYEMWEKETAEV